MEKLRPESGAPGLRLIPFDEKGFAPLMAQVPDARFLLQWAGPKYRFPLDPPQLQATVEMGRGDRPRNLAFSAILTNSSQPVGHIQIMNIDRESGCCTLGRIMIFKDYQGRGLGRQMVAKAVQYASEQLKLKTIRLSVFDFNTSAIGLYTSLGFKPHALVQGARTFNGEPWNLIRMALDLDSPEESPSS